MNLKNWWSFLRLQNILIVILTQYLLRFLIVKEHIENLNLGKFDFFILVLLTAIIAIGGNIINDIYDYSIDKINKPEKTFINQLITEKNAWKLYHFTNILAIFGSIYFFFFTHWKTGALYFSLTPFLLWLYSWRLKKTILFGNLVVATICALVPIMVIHAEFPNEDKGYMIAEFFIKFYAVFAFLSTLYREIIKDIEDKEGDKLYYSLTLPIVFGQRIAKIVALFIGLILLTLIAKILFYWRREIDFKLIYSILLIFLPICFSIFQLLKAKEKRDFHRISQTVKLIMLFGLLFLFVIGG
jgi:4-hydroxybenzoate polyprenyltransferase